MLIYFIRLSYKILGHFYDTVNIIISTNTEHCTKYRKYIGARNLSDNSVIIFKLVIKVFF